MPGVARARRSGRGGVSRLSGIAASLQRLDQNHLRVRIVALPDGHDPNSYFAAGATQSDFLRCLNQAQSL